MRSWVQQVRHIPWPFIILFDVAALVALALACALLFAHGHGRAKHAAKPTDKRIAISFDDAPRGAGGFLDPNVRPKLLIAALREAGVKQAVFFTNPGRIDPGGLNEANVLSYAKAGHVLADHTASHVVLRKVSAEAFLADIDKAESWLKKQHGYRPWFRFPQLDEGGRDTAKRDAVRAGLKARGLRNGYVTADGWDWYMEDLALGARERKQKIDYNGLRDLYVETHVQAADFADSLARRALGRAAAQMLLLHETDLAALYLPDLIKALRADGWTIITADQAYADPMGKLPPPVIADANGTLIQMISWDRHVKGPRWFERNEVDVMKKLFRERVLHE